MAWNSRLEVDTATLGGASYLGLPPSKPFHSIDMHSIEFNQDTDPRRNYTTNQKTPTTSRFQADAPNDRKEDANVQQYDTRRFKENSIWDVYNNEARMVDRELVKDWTTSLNSLLLFAAIFASVLTAFIIESKSHLEQSSTDVMASVMLFYTNNVLTGAHGPYNQVPFSPPSWAIFVNCAFFASLCASIVAALASVVALQWVGEYDAAITRGGSSPKDRFMRRQLRFGGVRSWKMGEIIAAIPLLLYISVLLFFIGLIQWMWIIQRAVGYIVLVGGASAFTFYFASTMAAVIFPTAPFRTPLSRSIYSVIHLPFSLVYHIRTHFGHGNMEWLDSKRYSKATTQNRDNETIFMDFDIIRDGLIWLSTHISISSDSHQRLLFLIREAASLSDDHIISREFIEAPWDKIFFQLGSYYLDSLHNSVYTDQDIEGMTILLKCYQRDRFRWHITHRGWSMYPPAGLFKKDTFVLDPPAHEGHNPTHSLLGHLPTAFDASPEVKVRYRLAQWYYLHKTMRLIPFGSYCWEGWEVRINKLSGPEEFQAELIKLTLDALERANRETNQSAIDAFMGLVSIEGTHFSRISSISLIMNNPLLYQLHSKAWIDWRCVQTLKTQVDIHRILAIILKAQKINPRLDPLWRCDFTESKLEEALSTVSSSNKSATIKIVKEELERPRLLDAFLTFDNLIHEGCTKEEHLVMIELLCRDLESAPYSFCERLHQLDPEIVPALRDPTLRLLMSASFGSPWKRDWPIITSDDDRLDSWVRASNYCCKRFPSIHPQQIGKLRIQLWDSFNHEVKNELFKTSLLDDEELKLLAIQFTQPELGIPHGEDYIFAQLSRLSSRWQVDHSFKAHLPSCKEIQDIRLTISILLRQDEDPFPQPTSPSLVISASCMEYLTQMAKSIKQDPGRLLNLLSDIYLSGVPDSDEFAAMVLILERHVDLNNHRISLDLRNKLVCQLHTIMDDPDQFTWWDLREEAQWTQRCISMIRRLEASQHHRFSSTSKRYLSCTRASYGQDVGHGWLGMYDGSRDVLTTRRVLEGTAVLRR